MNHAGAVEVRFLLKVLEQTKHFEANPELKSLRNLDIIKKRITLIFNEIESDEHSQEYVFHKIF